MEYRVLEALKAVEDVYHATAVSTICTKVEILEMHGVGPKTYRKYVRQSLESWRYARYLRRKYERTGKRDAAPEFKWKWNK